MPAVVGWVREGGSGWQQGRQICTKFNVNEMCLRAAAADVCLCMCVCVCESLLACVCVSVSTTKTARAQTRTHTRTDVGTHTRTYRESDSVRHMPKLAQQQPVTRN